MTFDKMDEGVNKMVLLSSTMNHFILWEPLSKTWITMKTAPILVSAQGRGRVAPLGIAPAQ